MSRSADEDRAGVAWQRGIWDRYPDLYQREVDQRFAPVVEQVLRHTTPVPGQHVLDLGTGTGAGIIADPHPEPRIDRCLATLYARRGEPTARSAGLAAAARGQSA